MIPSYSSQTFDQVLAEFDQTFGGVFLDPKIPMAYRKSKMLAEGGVILLPAGFEISPLIKELGLSFGERYLLIISYLYVSGLLWKKEGKQLGNFLPLHNLKLRRLGGEQYKRLVTYGRNQGHLIKSGKSAIQDKQSFEYRLNEKVLSLKSQCRYNLQLKPAIKARAQFVQESKTEFVGKGPAFDKITKSIDGLTFDYQSAIKHVGALLGQPTEEFLKNFYRRNFVEKLLLDSYGWKVDRQGRNYTVLVSAPRDIRRYFYFGQRPLYVVDISSSQPLLHLSLYPNDCDEKKRYQKLLEDGGFWDHMNEQAGSQFDLLDPDEKSKFKKEVFRQVFYFRGTPHGGKLGPMAILFRKEFPVLWDAIEEAKRISRKRA